MRINGAIPQHIVEKMGEGDRMACGVKTDAEKSAEMEKKSEAEIQKHCESWLKVMGFWPRSPAFLDGKIPDRGWYVHVHSAKKNPIVLDLLILGNDGRWLEVELKTQAGAVREHQAAILKSPNTVLCRSAEEFIEIINGWASVIEKGD